MKKDITQYNEKYERHGYWEYYWATGNLWFKGNFDDGKRHGYWEEYWFTGNLMYKGNYNNDVEIGLWEIYHSNGVLIEQILYT